jgi:hypothetical protein
MRLFAFDAASGRPVTDWESQGVRVSGLLQLGPDTNVNCLRFEANSLLGRHPTGREQLFAVVEGEGWVSGPDGARTPITSGQAVFWEVGESHESGTTVGMTVIVIQALRLDPAAVMGALDSRTPPE